MRRRFLWLASVAVAALLGTSSPVQAQIGKGEPTPWPQLPIPLHDGDKERGFYFAAEMLILRMDNPLGNEVLALRGVKDVDGTITGQAGFFLGSASIALKASDASVEDWSPGYRFTLGYRFDDSTSIYANYWQMVHNRSIASAGILPGNFNVQQNFSDSFFFVPFFNFNPFFAGPTEDVLPQSGGDPIPAYGIFNAAEAVFVQFEQNFWSWEITGKFPVQLMEECRNYCLIGPRFMYLQEHFKFQITDLTINGELSAENVAIYRNNWSNRFLGIQTGWGIEKYLGAGFGVTAEARVGLFADIQKTANKLERLPRGVHDVIEGRHTNDVAFTPMFQFGLYLEWLPIDGVQFRAGYEFMGMLNTQRSSFPVDFNVGSLAPNYENKFFRLDGFNVGIALIF